MSDDAKPAELTAGQSFVDPLMNATQFLKFTSGGKHHPRDVKISMSQSIISWKSPKKGPGKTMIPFSEIKEIRLGLETKKFKKADPALADRAFSIVYGGAHKTLDLVAENKDVREIWTKTLQEIMNSSKDADPINVFLQQAWIKADKNGDGQLDLEEVLKLLKSLNVALSKSQVKATFKKVDGGKGFLDFQAFTEFYKILKYRSEIKDIFTSLSKTTPNVLTQAELKKFLEEEQKMTVTDEQVAEMAKKYASDGYSHDGCLSLEGFSKLLLNETDVRSAQREKIFMDMDRPLTHYWINSSHNTYLLQDQLKGPSSVEAYIRALRLGCRCVELDCWDGPNGPIVYHGHTLTSKILFKDVIEAINKYAFETSPYPVILSLEVHTSIEQQDQMATIMKSILGDKIVTDPLPEGELLPSPEKLKNRIIIKGKALPKGTKQEEFEDDDEDDDDEDEPEEVKQMKEKEGKKKGSKVKVAQSLSDLVTYCKTAGFKSFDESKEKGKPDQMSSFAEGKSEKLASGSRDAFIGYNRKQLSRIYPAGGRVDSSNYDPHLHWNAGCQIVAFNFQTLDRTMQLNIGKFLDNGNSGYVLKPQWMLEDGASKSPSKKLTIRVLSAQQLPKPGQSNKGEVIDPYVEIDICGEDADCVSKKTKVIDDNGFNPSWDESFDFNVTTPELTLVRFAIFDKDVNSDDFIASATVSFESILPGYRHLKLRDSKNSLLALGTLFVHITIS